MAPKAPSSLSMKAATFGLGCFAALTNVSGFVSHFRPAGLGKFGPRAPLTSETSTLRMKKGAMDHVSSVLLCFVTVGIARALYLVHMYV